MRLVFMGTPEFAVPPLHALVESGYPVTRVVTQPDRPRGRGKKLTPGPVKSYCLNRGLDVLQPAKITDPAFIELIRTLAADVIVVVAYGRILPPGLLTIPRLGCVNVHASLLPRYRGAAPVHWAVINGEPETGVTTMLMDEGLDTGDILLQERLPIGPDDNMGLVHDRLARLGAALLVKTLDRLERGRLEPRPQDGTRATYAPPVGRKHELIDWTRPATEIKNLVRGLDPWPGAYTTLGDKQLKIWRADVVYPDGTGEPGRVLSADAERGLVVQTGGGALRIHELQTAGRKRLSVAKFLRGHPLTAGGRLGEHVSKSN
ncbi:MAG: methionyl-tRNA formyltransferase [Candidatus Desulforudis sp.]|nr:methionyl-tRNA formyltransferase [Desulforudis sp.]